MSDDEKDFLPLVGENNALTLRDDTVVMIPFWRLVGIVIISVMLGASVPTIIFGTERSAAAVAMNSEQDLIYDPNDKFYVGERQPPETDALSPQHEHDPSGDFPRLAWLMSFPNSGTSYTLSLVTAASNITQASNYGWEQHTHGRETNVSEELFPGGPFWLDPDYTRPTDAVLTKTHCGGYCTQCRAGDNAETPHSFLMHCATSTSRAYETAKNGKPRHVKRTYNYNEVVDRAVHLIRDPLDNIVSRYHLAIEMPTVTENPELVERYTYDREGFATYCNDILREEEEHSEGHIDQEILAMVEDVPCHLDLFRYIQWHNLAFIATDDFLNVPTLVMHYEDYTTNFNQTLGSLMTFLNLPSTGFVEEFKTGKSYRGYYSEEQVAAMRNATLRLASIMTWRQLERYFL